MFRLLYKTIFRLQLKRRFLYTIGNDLKTPFELRPEDGFIKKSKHVVNMIF